MSETISKRHRNLWRTPITQETGRFFGGESVCGRIYFIQLAIDLSRLRPAILVPLKNICSRK